MHATNNCNHYHYIDGACVYMSLLLLHEQFSKIFIGHLNLSFSTASFLLPLPGHHPREQGDMCLTLAGTVNRGGREGGKEGRCEWREDTDNRLRLHARQQ